MDVLFYSEKDLFLRPCGSRGLLPSTHILHSNGLAPDNLFFHGVACNCVKIQLAHLGLETEFAQCEIQVKEEEWQGVRRKYWHGRDTYYLPIATWKQD